MGLGGVAIAILPSIICLKLTFSDGLGGAIFRVMSNHFRIPPFKSAIFAPIGRRGKSVFSQAFLFYKLSACYLRKVNGFVNHLVILRFLLVEKRDTTVGLLHHR